jgi:hypothetical protein
VIPEERIEVVQRQWERNRRPVQAITAIFNTAAVATIAKVFE